MSNTLGAKWSWWWSASNEKDELSRAFLTALVTIFTALCFLWTVKKSRKVSPPFPPGPRGLPLLGYLPFLGTDLHREFTELAGIYGPIYKLWLGKKLCVVLSSPSLIKEVVRDHDTVFANRDPTIATLAGSFGGLDILFLPYGPDWKKLRKLFVREMLSNANLDNTYALRREAVKESIRNVYEKKGTPIDIGELAFVTVINSIMNMVWGGTLQGEKAAIIGAQFKELMAEQVVLFGKPNVSDLFPVLARFDLQGIERQAKRNLKQLERNLDYVIEKRMALAVGKGDGAGKIEQKDFLQVLLELRENEEAETSISMNQLKALLLDVVAGGTETTGTMVEWVTTRLLQHPKIMEKVQEELTQVVGLNNLVEEFHLPKLHYLDAVIKETFRLHTPLPLLAPRCPSQSGIIGGYTVPQGTKVFLNVWAMHMDPKLWDNPMEFQPERFLYDPSTFDYSGNNFKYLPFGSGRRICPGITLAQKSLIYVTASLLHSFEWKLPHGTELDFSDKFGIVVKKMKPLVAIPTPRLSKSDLYI